METGTLESPDMVIEVTSPPAEFLHDQRERGWRLLRNTPLQLGRFILEPMAFLGDTEEVVDEEMVLARAEEMGNPAGQFHAEWLFQNWQGVPPKEWREGAYLLFAGTRWENKRGNLFLPFLLWHGAAWSMQFYWLGLGCRSFFRIVRWREFKE